MTRRPDLVHEIRVSFADPKRVARFWQRVDKNGPTPQHVAGIGRCWLWKTRARARYGRFHWGPRRGHASAPAHVVSWFLANGRWPEPHCLHRCDNPRCVNPDHLFEGTQADNIRDMVAKRRGRTRNQTGQRHAMTALDDALVSSIRTRVAAGEWVAVVAKELGLPRGVVLRAVRGKSFTYLPGAVASDGKQHYRVGADHHGAKLSSVTVRQIRMMAESGVGQRAIAKAVGISQTLVGKVVRREAWASV